MRGLRAIADLAGVRRRILIHLGRRPLRSEDGIEAMPAEAFAEALAAERI